MTADAKTIAIRVPVDSSAVEEIVFFVLIKKRRLK